MSLFKRICSISLVSLLALGLLPLQASAVTLTNASISILPGTTTSFSPQNNEVATINYQVSDNSALQVLTRVYTATGNDVAICCGSQTGGLVATLEGPVSKSAGTYSIPWYGKISNATSGTSVAVGQYCYMITWANGTGYNNIGVPYTTTGIQKGFINVATAGG